MKKILITGSNSYVGVSVEQWLMKVPKRYIIDTLDMKDNAWKQEDFGKYDVVFHVAGLAHADVGKVSEERKQLYYKVNTRLAVQVAQKSKSEGVKQFIFMSSMIVYSGCKERFITKETIPIPFNCYGDSKWRADQKVRALGTEDFKVVVVRPPMIYGKNSKGNYPELSKLASKLLIFPVVRNKRSMIHIDNFCEFIKLIIDNEESGIFFPQNEEYVETSQMVKMIAQIKGHRLILLPGFERVVKVMMKIPGKIGTLTTKAFGDYVYDLKLSEYKYNYRVVGFEESIRRTEG